MKKPYNLIDLTGKRFGKLVVLKRVENHITKGGQVRPQWQCLCDCGNTIIVQGVLLRKGEKTHCGCIPYVQMLKRKCNKYDLSGEYGVGYTSKNEPFWFDLEDYDKIKNLTWHYTRNYVTAVYNRQTIKLHRLVMGVTDPKIFIDHIHHYYDTPLLFDNRKSNLRIATPSQNEQNKKLQSNNKSGYPGISWDKHNQKWQVYIDVNRQRIFLGRYISFEDALIKRKKAEQQYFKDFCFTKNNQYNNTFKKGG